MNYFSVFDFNKLDVLHNLSSISECIDGIRQFAAIDDRYNPEITNNELCDIWGFCVFMHKEKITEPTGTSRKVIEGKYDVAVIYDYNKTIVTETERTTKLKATMSARELFEKVKNEINLERHGKLKVYSRKKLTIFNTGSETLYGYIIDYFRDYYSNERPVWDDAARLLIGDFVISNSIL